MQVVLIAQLGAADSDEALQFLVFVGLVLLFSGFVGYLIGDSKGKGGLGFFLGLILGFIGWIIIAVAQRTPEKEAEYQAKVAEVQGVAPPSYIRDPCWAEDPYGRHDHRWFNGNRWSPKVADAGSESSDPATFPLPDGAADGEGWAADPFGRFPQRFYKNGEWTGYVTRDGKTTSDPVGFAPPPPDDSIAV
jgi:preprotein translocase subunit Sss1